MSKTKKRILHTLVLALWLGTSSVAPAQAGLFGGGGLGKMKIPSPSQIAAELEQRYNVNLGSVQNQNQYLNVADQKKTAPEVSLSFLPTDPKEGEKITALALPIYFSNSEDQLYYSWYLKRDRCEGNDDCDYNDDGDYNQRDWKIEAARILAQNGYENGETVYPPDPADRRDDPDGDGYESRIGGDNRVNVPDYCYVHDPRTGNIYELAEVSGSVGFACPTGTSAVCIDTTDDINPSNMDFSNTGNQQAFSVDIGTGSVIGAPLCSNSTPVCTRGEACCVSNPATATSCENSLSSCVDPSFSGDQKNVENLCKHLFPDMPGRTTGDGSFLPSEEEFWGTDPNDPSTASNGRKDEANVVGLGLKSFSWNYEKGDEVGVAVEGTSILPTKHDDSSGMVMWALPRNRCYPNMNEDTEATVSSYTRQIRGFAVTIPTTDLELDRCIPDNLVDPTEGGQASNLIVGVSASPESPTNDESGDKGGDVVSAFATVENAVKDQSNIRYEWQIDFGRTPQFSDLDGRGVEEILRDRGLVGSTVGNALESVSLALNMRTTDIVGKSGKRLSSFLSNGTGYIRFRLTAEEGFDGNAVRRGRGDVIVKFISTGKKISAYMVEATVVDGKTQVRIPTPRSASLICNNSALERAACRVLKNEIIGLSVDPEGLSDFHWTVNGVPLVCSKDKVSPNCGSIEILADGTRVSRDATQNEFNFLPITDDPGHSYSVMLTANDVETGKSITLSRVFHVIDPIVTILPGAGGSAWKKLLGYYRDVLGTATTACPNGLCPQYSDRTLQAYAGDSVTVEAQFEPGFVMGRSQYRWLVDDVVVEESSSGKITIPGDGTVAGSVRNVVLDASFTQSDAMRRALYDIWKITPLDSPEVRFGGVAQIELQAPDIASNDQGPKKYLALLTNAFPPTLLFALRILLSAFLILFAIHFLFTFVPSRAKEGQ